MRNIHNGGPAFPLPGGDYNTPEYGMYLRDWLAGQALMSLPHLCAHDTLLGGMTFEQHVARGAVRLADAVLAELDKEAAQ